MSGKQRQVVPPAPVKKPQEPAKQPDPPASNSAIQGEMNREAGKGSFTAPKVIGGADAVVQGNPLHTKQSGSSSPPGRRTPGKTQYTSDPQGAGVTRTEVIDEKTLRRPGTGKKSHIAGKKDVTTRTRGAQVSGGNVQLGQSTETQRYRGKNGTSSKSSNQAVDINFANPMDSKFSVGSGTTDHKGNGRGQTTTFGANGISNTQSVTRGNHTFSGGGHLNTNEFGAHGGYAYKTKGGSSIGGSLNASMKMGRVMGKTVTKDDPSSMVHNRALQISGADKIDVHYRDNGFSIGGGLNAQFGAVGLSAHGHYANETSVGYHTTGDKSQKERHERGEELIRASDGELADKMDDLAVLGRTNDDGKKVAGLQKGEGVTLQTSTAKGGGGGLSVYGIGGSGSYATEQVQRTVVHRQDDGSYTIDITTADLQQAKGEGHVGGGALAAGYKADWGKASNINLNFKDSKEGRRKMQEFMDTGVIPGAIGERDPDREVYDRLVQKGKKNWSKADKAEMARVADRANNAYMQPKKYEASKHGDSDVKIKTEAGQHKKSAAYVSTMGFEVGSNGERNSSRMFTYTEGGTKQVGDGGEHHEDKVIAAEESFEYEFNSDGYMDTSIRAYARNWGGEHQDEFENSGQHYPKFSSWRGSKTGNAGVYADGKKGTSTASIYLTDREVKTFEGKAKNLDLTSLTKEDRAAVAREAELRRKANKPLTDDEIADHLASKQAASSLDDNALEMMGIKKGSPEYKEMVEDKKKEFLSGGTDAYLDGKTQDDLTRAAQEIKNPLHDALRRGKASDLQHALSQIKSGGDFTNAPYEVKRALLERVTSGKAGNEDIRGVQHDNRTWQAALALMMGADHGDPGKTDRARTFHNMARDKIDGNNNRDNSGSPANQMMEIVGQVIPDIADLPQTGSYKDKRALRDWINGQIRMTRH